MAKVGDVLLQVTAIDLDYKENSTVTYYIKNTQLFKPGTSNLTWSSVLNDPFSIDQSGRISTVAFLAEYSQGRFDLQITAKEIESPYRIDTTIVTVIKQTFFYLKIRMKPMVISLIYFRYGCMKLASW